MAIPLVARRFILGVLLFCRYEPSNPLRFRSLSLLCPAAIHVTNNSVEASPPWSLYALTLALDQRTSTTTRSNEVKNAEFTESRIFSPDSLASISKHQKPIALDWPRLGHTGTYYAHELWYTRTSHEWSNSVAGHKLGVWTGSESGPSHNRQARSRESTSLRKVITSTMLVFFHDATHYLHGKIMSCLSSGTLF
jgi:hypothetical protein